MSFISFMENGYNITHDIKLLKLKYPYAKILITGHSLGGAISPMLATELLQYNIKADEIYTFESPRIGNQEYNQYLNDNFDNI